MKTIIIQCSSTMKQKIFILHSFFETYNEITLHMDKNELITYENIQNK